MFGEANPATGQQRRGESGQVAAPHPHNASFRPQTRRNTVNIGMKRFASAVASICWAKWRWLDGLGCCSAMDKFCGRGVGAGLLRVSKGAGAARRLRCKDAVEKANRQARAANQRARMLECHYGWLCHACFVENTARMPLVLVVLFSFSWCSASCAFTLASLRSMGVTPKDVLKRKGASTIWVGPSP